MKITKNIFKARGFYGKLSRKIKSQRTRYQIFAFSKASSLRSRGFSFYDTVSETILKNFLFILFFAYFLFFNPALAITFPNSNDFNILPSNRFPYPFEEIEIKIGDASFDITRSYIVWYADGKKVSESKGNDKINFKAGEAGSKTTITAAIQIPNGGDVRKSITLNVSDIDLLWQANTYTPYFYKGKSFTVPLSEVRMGAFAYFNSQNKKTASENLFFKWFLNDNLEDQGQRKDAFVFKTGVFSDDDYNIKVEISSSDNKLFQQKSINLAVQKPEILFYEYSPLQGTKHQKAISQFKNPVGQYKQFIAEPFFVPYDKKGGLNYEWSVNGQKLKNLNEPLNTINFSSEQGQEGLYNIDLIISYKNLLEKVSNGFSVNLE